MIGQRIDNKGVGAPRGQRLEAHTRRKFTQVSLLPPWVATQIRNWKKRSRFCGGTGRPQYNKLTSQMDLSRRTSRRLRLSQSWSGELAFDWTKSSNKQQTSVFLNAATFLVMHFLVMSYTFLQNCDSTQFWARLKHFISLLQYKTKLNPSIADRNKRKNTDETSSPVCWSLGNFHFTHTVHQALRLNRRLGCSK